MVWDYRRESYLSFRWERTFLLSLSISFCPLYSGHYISWPVSQHCLHCIFLEIISFIFQRLLLFVHFITTIPHVNWIQYMIGKLINNYYCICICTSLLYLHVTIAFIFFQLHFYSVTINTYVNIITSSACYWLHNYIESTCKSCYFGNSSYITSCQINQNHNNIFFSYLLYYKSYCMNRYIKVNIKWTSYILFVT